jgi:hypothetical protein
MYLTLFLRITSQSSKNSALYMEFMHIVTSLRKDTTTISSPSSRLGGFSLLPLQQGWACKEASLNLLSAYLTVQLAALRQMKRATEMRNPQSLSRVVPQCLMLLEGARCTAETSTNRFAHGQIPQAIACIEFSFTIQPLDINNAQRWTQNQQSI